MFHRDVLTISYRHRYEIKRIFQEVLGIYGIEHVSLDLVSPTGEMIFFSGTPSHGYEVCSRGLGEFDGAISQEAYQNFEFYWWKDVEHKAFSAEINYIRDVKHKFKHGFMLVRKWNDFHLVYSFATRNTNPEFVNLITNNLNHLLEIGDYLYNEMRDTYAEYTGLYRPPKIEQFYAFEGGKPPARYDAHYQKSKQGILSPSHQTSLNASHLQLVVDNRE